MFPASEMLAVSWTVKFAEDRFCKMSARESGQNLQKRTLRRVCSLFSNLGYYLATFDSCISSFMLFRRNQVNLSSSISSVSYTYAQRRKVDMQSVSFPSPSPPHLLIRIFFSPRPRSSSVRRYFLEAVAPENTRFVPRDPRSLARGRFPAFQKLHVNLGRQHQLRIITRAQLSSVRKRGVTAKVY